MSAFNFSRTGIEAPCKDCPDRHGGCYAECEKYQAYEKEKFKRLEQNEQDRIRSENSTKSTVGYERRKRNYVKNKKRNL